MATRNQTRPVRPAVVQRPPPQGRKPGTQPPGPRTPANQTPRIPGNQVPRQPVSQSPRPPAPPAQRLLPPAPPAQPTIVVHNPADVKTGNGHQSPQNTMDIPASIPKIDAKDKPYLDYLNDYVVDWQEPLNLETIKSPRFRNAGLLSPKLRPIGTPPSLVTYQNRYNLRPAADALPTFSSGRFTTSGGLDTSPLYSTDYRFEDNLDSYGRRPSPLSHFKFSNDLYRRPQPFGVEPRLNLAALTLDSSVGGTYALPSDRLARGNNPPSRYPDLERLDTFVAPGVQHEPTNLAFVPHEGATNHYVEEFIGHYIEDQFLPDILHETINELGHEKKRRSAEVHRHVVDPFRLDTDKHVDENQRNNTHLYSDDWIRELGLYQQRLRMITPTSNADTNMSLLRRKDYKEAPPIRLGTPLRFHDLMPDAQNRVLADYSQEWIDFELNDLLRDVGRTSLDEERHDFHHNPAPVVVHSPPKRSTDQGQYKSIETYAGNNLVDTICLDNLIVRYINQTGSVLDYDDNSSRLLDGTMLDNLIHQYHQRDEYR